MEFIIRSFGGRVGWPESSGSGSPYDENDESITHVIIDRPLVPGQSVIPPPQPTLQPIEETEDIRERKRRRKYIQPQWVVDCINAGKLVKEDKYERGKILPPHLSPFGEGKDTYIPDVEDDQAQENDMEGVEMEDEVSEDESEDEGVEDGEDDEEADTPVPTSKKVLKALAADAQRDSAARRAAELQAEAAGVDFGAFEKAVKKEKKAAKQKPAQPNPAANNDKEDEMNKMLMSNKQRKLYEKMKYGERKREAERTVLEQKKAAIKKDKFKEAMRQKQGKV
jgi:pescadillo protein